MARSVDCNIVILHLKEAKKNYRMDICRGNIEIIQNGAIIIDKQLETIYYFPESFSNQEVQAQMKTNSCRIFPSVRKCLFNLNQQKRNIVLVDTNYVCATEPTDSLVQIFLDISNKYGKIFQFEYDAVKNCLKEKTKSKNGVTDAVSSTRTERSQRTIDWTNSNLPLRELSVYPIFRTDPNNVPLLAKIVHCRIDQLFDAPSSMGEIVPDEGGPDSLSPQAMSQHDTDKGGFVAIAVGNTYCVSSILPRHGTFKTNDARIASFANISEVRGLDTKRMAWNGLFYTGSAVQCFQCGIEIRNLRHDKDSLLEHIQESPDCPFLMGLLGVKSLNEYKAQIRLSGTISECGHGPVGSTGGTSIQVSTVCDHNRIAQYQLYSVRQSTFAKWPTSMSQTPKQLAKAGFYYTGLQDAVRCFSCNGHVKNWDADSNPWIEHARRFPQCAFVQHVKGQEFIDLVRRTTEEFDEEEDVVDHPTFLRNILMTDTPDLQHLNLRKDPGRDTILRENKSLKLSVFCMKCNIRMKTILFLPCTHHCLCQVCAEGCTMCPVCYKNIMEKHKTQMI